MIISNLGEFVMGDIPKPRMFFKKNVFGINLNINVHLTRQFILLWWYQLCNKY